VIRRAETRADFEAHAACWSAVWPDDAVSVEFMLDRLAREPERLYVNVWEGDRVVAIGFVGRSSRPGYRPVAVTVLPERRGRGLGSELLARCLDHARLLGGARALGFVREDDGVAVAFVHRRGFEVLDRVVSLALELDPGLEPPAPPAGIRIAELDAPRHEAAFEVYAQGVRDMPTAAPLDAGSFSDWLAEIETRPLTLLALEGDRVVGYADLEVRNAPARVAGNGMTTVLPSHRGRGIAEALKRTQIAWAAKQGYRRVTTATHSDNEPMRCLNEKLGYRELPAILDVTRPL
jgi:GNAT superfamily N-acetyltransferase